MNLNTENFVRPGYETRPDPDFPLAPLYWSRQEALALAKAEGIGMTEEHWQVVCALQEFYARHDGPTVNMRELHDALDESFHPEGGIRHLYELFPRGPVAQGCRIAGLQAPSGARDQGFGSAV